MAYCRPGAWLWQQPESTPRGAGGIDKLTSRGSGGRSCKGPWPHLPRGLATIGDDTEFAFASVAASATVAKFKEDVPDAVTSIPDEEQQERIPPQQWLPMGPEYGPSSSLQLSSSDSDVTDLAGSCDRLVMPSCQVTLMRRSTSLDDVSSSLRSLISAPGYHIVPRLLRQESTVEPYIMPFIAPDHGRPFDPCTQHFGC